MAPKVFVAQPIPVPALDRLREYADVEVFPFEHREVSVAELESAARRSDYIFCMHITPITASIVAANPNLKGFGVSAPRTDVQDLAACDAAGIPLLVAKPTPQPPPDAGGAEFPWQEYALNPRCTADLMVGHILNLAYRVVEADRFCRGTGYFQEQSMSFMGQGCTGKTVSLYGLGRVARHAVKRLRALDMNVLYTKRTRLSSEEEEELGVEWMEDKDELIALGDYVCMLANFEEANYKIFGAREFALMKPSAYFINVARGRLVEEDALIDALEKGTIAGAGLDVFITEPPLVYDSYIPEALREMDNVVLTPHNGGATHDSRRTGTLAVANAIVDDIIARGGERLSAA
jgi:lactate dehydrogenase-like 2-hydroxyacid dehydrogenase